MAKMTIAELAEQLRLEAEAAERRAELAREEDERARLDEERQLRQLDNIEKELGKRQALLDINKQADQIKKDALDTDYQSLGLLQGFADKYKKHHEIQKSLIEMQEHKRALEEESRLYEEQISVADLKHDAILKAKLETLKEQKDLEIELKDRIINKTQNVAAQVNQAGMMGGLGTKIGGLVSSYKIASQSQLATIISGISSMLSSVVGMMWDIFKTVLDALWGQAKAISLIFLDIQSGIGNLAADLGLSVVQTAQLFANIKQIGNAALLFGVSFKEALGFMRSFSEVTGINRVFLEKEILQLSAVAKATGLGAEEAGKMNANMELIGMSTNDFHTYVMDTRKQAGLLNLNITKVLKTVDELAPAFRGLNFKGGVKEFTELVERAQGLRFELTNMRPLANQVFNPEGAIELGARLRVLGGNFAKMSDTFGLMLKAQTDPAALMTDVMNTMSTLATKGADGIFTISPVNQAMIREFAEATGESPDNLINGTLQMAKQADILSKLRIGIDKKDRELIGNLAEKNDKGGYSIKVDPSGTNVAIENLSTRQLKAIKAYRENEIEVSRKRMDLVDQFKNIYDRLLMSLAPLVQRISDIISKNPGFLTHFMAKMEEFGNYLGKKLNDFITTGGIDKLIKSLTKTMDDVFAILSGEGSLAKKLGQLLGEAIAFAFKTALPVVQEALSSSGVGQTGRGLASAAVGFGAASTLIPLGLSIGGPWGGVVGGAIAAILAIATQIGLGGWGASGDSSSGGNRPANDFIMRSNGSIQHFNKGDTLIGGTNLGMSQQDSATTKMISSRSIMEQTKIYNKSQFSNLSAGPTKSSPEAVNFNITGTLQVKGDNNSAYLTSADLKNIGIQQLAYMVMNETDRFKNHQSSKKLQSEIITPIRST